MAPPTVRLASDSRGLISVAAAFTAGALFAARPLRPSGIRAAVTMSAATLMMLSLLRPSGNMLRAAGRRRRSGNVRFSLIIPRPVEQVFALCADFENFPRVITFVERVIDYGDGRSHWCATTPSGATVQWNTVTTKFVTNNVIGWRSTPGGDVDMTGMLRFSPDGDGTCVRISLDYDIKSLRLRDAVSALLAPRNATVVENNIRGMAARLTTQPIAVSGELPPIVGHGLAAIGDGPTPQS